MGSSHSYGGRSDARNRGLREEGTRKRRGKLPGGGQATVRGGAGEATEERAPPTTEGRAHPWWVVQKTYLSLDTGSRGPEWLE